MQVPFTAYFRIVPVANNTTKVKRSEAILELQKAAASIFEALDVVESINLALPGGGQYSAQTKFSDLGSGGAVKPQFGEFPAQVVVTGFYDDGSEENASPYPSRTMITTGEYLTGHTAALHVAGPMQELLDAVVAFREVVDNAFVAYDLPSWFELSWYKLDYKGVTFGHKGIHFPR